MIVDSQGNEIGKLFVGGLHQATTNDSLKAYFSQFGDIEESVVMMDSRTGRSRGFGYIKFKENSSVDSVLAQKSHSIDHKEVDPKRCNVNMKGKNRRSLKVFVGGISFEHDETTIRNFFSKYGRVTEVNLLVSPNKQRHRGFAFVGFDDEEVVKALIQLHYLNMDGKKVEIKAMEPPVSQRFGYPPSNTSIQSQLNGRAVRGVRGGGHFTSLQPHDSYIPWNQWTSLGAAGWTPFVDGTHSWPPSNVGWLNRTNGTSATDRLAADYVSSGRLTESNNHASVLGWPQSPTVSTTPGWLPPDWNHPSAVIPSSANPVPIVDDDIARYTTPNQLSSHKPGPAWDHQLCYTPASTPAVNPGDFLAQLEAWNHSANTPVYQTPLPSHCSDWNPQIGVPPAAGLHQWRDPCSTTPAPVPTDTARMGNFQQGLYLPDSRATSSQPNAAMAAMLAAATAAALNLNASNGNMTLPQWSSTAAAAVAAATELGNLKLDDTVYRSPTTYGFPGHDAQLASGRPDATAQTTSHSLTGLLTGEWLANSCPSTAEGSNHTLGGHQHQPACASQHLYER